MYLFISVFLAFGIVKASSFDDDALPNLVRRQTSSRVALSSPDEPTMTGTISTCDKWYDVVPNDTCDAVAQSFGITLSQFLAWNPAVSSDCLQNFDVGDSYCVGVGTSSITTSNITTPSTSYSSSTITSNYSTTLPATLTTPYSTLSVNTTSASNTLTNSAWPPSQTQPGQPSYCNRWYQAFSGETCESIVAQFDTWMDINDFIAWNPAVGANCTSIYYGYWYCVGIQPQTSMIDNTTATSQWFPSWTPSIPPTFNTSWVATPTQTGIASDCKVYYEAGTNDTCESISTYLGYLTVAELENLNPALGSNCAGLQPGYYYCVINGTDLPLPFTTNSTPSPVQSGIVSTCTSWYQTTPGDDCGSITEMFGTFSESDFLSWNPAVGQDCSCLVIGDYYCVAIPSTPTTRTAPVPPYPTASNLPGTISSCNSYWLVGVDDNCTSITTENNITLADFVSWNPSLGPAADCNVTENTYVCVGVNSNVTSIPSTPVSTSTLTSSTSTSSSSGATPTPVQTGMVSGCTRFYFVEPENDCYDIALDAGIALDSFYSWNPALNGDCSGLQADVYVCIGLSGPGTTITTGNPVPLTPTPTQSGMVSGCVRFYDVEAGDGCYTIASDAGVPLTDFYSWNPAVSTDCAGLEAGVFVCIGTSGPMTTITSGTPVSVPAMTTSS